MIHIKCNLKNTLIVMPILWRRKWENDLEILEEINQKIQI